MYTILTHYRDFREQTSTLCTSAPRRPSKGILVGMGVVASKSEWNDPELTSPSRAPCLLRYKIDLMVEISGSRKYWGMLKKSSLLHSCCFLYILSVTSGLLSLLYTHLFPEEGKWIICLGNLDIIKLHMYNSAQSFLLLCVSFPRGASNSKCYSWIDSVPQRTALL